MKKRKKSKTTQVYFKKMAKRERNRKDKEWREKVRAEFENKCMICGRTDILHVHHLIPRENKLFRQEVLNGVLLCPLHHKYSFECSPHKNSLAFYLWYIEHYKDRYEKLLEMYLNNTKSQNENNQSGPQVENI